MITLFVTVVTAARMAQRRDTVGVSLVDRMSMMLSRLAIFSGAVPVVVAVVVLVLVPVFLGDTALHPVGLRLTVASLAGAVLHALPTCFRQEVRPRTLACDVRYTADEAVVALCSRAVALRLRRGDRVRHRGAILAPSASAVVRSRAWGHAEEERNHADSDAMDGDPTRTLRSHVPSWALCDPRARYLAW